MQRLFIFINYFQQSGRVGGAHPGHDQPGHNGHGGGKGELRHNVMTSSTKRSNQLLSIQKPEILAHTTNLIFHPFLVHKYVFSFLAFSSSKE